MRSRWNLPVYVAYVALCLVAAGFVVLQLGVTMPWTHPYQLTADFRDGAGILANDEVFMNGTKVGRITNVDAVGSQARVSMDIDDHTALPLYRSATAQVRIKNLLGETYVELTRGDAQSGTMPSGGSIGIEHTVTPVQIDEVLAILDPQTRQRLQLLINGAGDAFNNRGGDMNDQAHSLSSLTTSLNGPAALLATRQQQLEDIVLELQRLYDTLARQRDQVRQGFGVWNDVTAQMAAQEQQIGGTVQQADTLLQNLDQLVTGEAPAISAALDTLPTALQNTNAFLDQSNTILGALVPVKRSIHDVFPHLSSSFADTDPISGQHFWSVYSVNCGSDCTNQGASATVPGPGSSNSTWASVTAEAGP